MNTTTIKIRYTIEKEKIKITVVTWSKKNVLNENDEKNIINFSTNGIQNKYSLSSESQTINAQIVK